MPGLEGPLHRISWVPTSVGAHLGFGLSPACSELRDSIVRWVNDVRDHLCIGLGLSASNPWGVLRVALLLTRSIFCRFYFLLHPATSRGGDQAVMPTPRGRRRACSKSVMSGTIPTINWLARAHTGFIPIVAYLVFARCRSRLCPSVYLPHTMS
jgi:hypothetical protein